LLLSIIIDQKAQRSVSASHDFKNFRLTNENNTGGLTSDPAVILLFNGWIKMPCFLPKCTFSVVQVKKVKSKNMSGILSCLLYAKTGNTDYCYLEDVTVRLL